MSPSTKSDEHNNVGYENNYHEAEKKQSPISSDDTISWSESLSNQSDENQTEKSETESQIPSSAFDQAQTIEPSTPSTLTGDDLKSSIIDEAQNSFVETDKDLQAFLKSLLSHLTPSDQTE